MIPSQRPLPGGYAGGAVTRVIVKSLTPISNPRIGRLSDDCCTLSDQFDLRGLVTISFACFAVLLTLGCCGSQFEHVCVANDPFAIHTRELLWQRSAAFLQDIFVGYSKQLPSKVASA